MKQLAQYQDGRLELQEVPAPQPPPGGILVRTTASVISPGTEKMKVEQARMSLLAKARARPDQVRKVLDTAKNLGWKSALEKVKNRLESPAPLGYSAAGVVIAVDEKNHRFQVGDRVACGGAEYANHAEIIAVPDLLAAPVPSGVADWQAAYTSLVSIAMEAVRQAEVSLGDRLLILGQGLVGLLCTAVARAAGARVLAVDPVQQRLSVARQMGAESVAEADSQDIAELVKRWTNGLGVDVVLICVGGKETSLIEQSISCVRDRGTIMIVGMYDAQLSWKTAYMKQVQIRYARSYGPGRYDAAYEWAGHDYPAGHVRWTENRNFEACLHLMQSKALPLELLTTRQANFVDAMFVYSTLMEAGNADIGVVLNYDTAYSLDTKAISLLPTSTEQTLVQPAVSKLSVIGAGNFARTMLLPHVKKRISLHTVVNATPLSARHVKEKFGFAHASTDVTSIWATTSAVLISTRHHLHAPLVILCLQHQRHLFVEKPLCLTQEELRKIDQAYQGGSSIMVGFNRRFAPAMVALKERIDATNSALSLNIIVNSGPLSSEHWYAHLDESGGRIIGEGCHFYDLACYFLGTPLRVTAQRVGRNPVSDSVAAQIEFANGSTAQILYSAEGDPAYPKESYRLIAPDWVAESENALTLIVYERRKRKQQSFSSKGHAEEMDAWLSYLQGKTAHPMSWESIYTTMKLTFAIVQAVQECRTVELH